MATVDGDALKKKAEALNIEDIDSLVKAKAQKALAACVKRDG